MAYWLSRYGKRGCVLGVVLLLSSPWLQAAGMRSPEAVAQAFALAYRHGDTTAIVGLEYFADGAAAAGRERNGWLRHMSSRSLRSYRMAPLLAQDQSLLRGTALLAVKKLVVEYEGREGRVQEVYLIGQAGGAFYLLPVHAGQ